MKLLALIRTRTKTNRFDSGQAPIRQLKERGRIRNGTKQAPIKQCVIARTWQQLLAILEVFSDRVISLTMGQSCLTITNLTTAQGVSAQHYLSSKPKI
jgi:hypothetical protein